MKEEILQSIKKEYQEKKQQQNNTIEILKKIEELEQNEIVKEYLNLTEQINTVDYSQIIAQNKDDLLESAFRKHSNLIKETNGIYVCLGTFMMDNICDIEHGPSDYRVRRNDPKAEYRVYQDLENYNTKQIPIKQCEEFENTHTVIIPKTILTEKYYYELQREFLKNAVKYGQEKACQKVLKKIK